MPRLAREDDGELVAGMLAAAYRAERMISIGLAHLESVHQRPAARVVDEACRLLRPWSHEARIELRGLRRPVRRNLLAWLEQGGAVTVVAAARRKLVLVPGTDSREAIEASLSPTRRKMLRLAERDGEHCVWCSTPLTYESVHATLDHIRCRSHGGADALDNLVLACAPCNHRRANLPAHVWLDVCLQRGAEVDFDAIGAALVRSERHHRTPAVALPAAA